jgi:hypothetical protein
VYRSDSSAAALERLKALPLDQALQSAGALLSFSAFQPPGLILSTAYPPPQ